MMKASRVLAALGSVLLLASAGAHAAGRLDDGLLDPAWFGQNLEFRKAEEIDYLWVADGFSLQGKTLKIADWEDPQFLGKKRDAKDSARAYDVTASMPNWLRGGLGNALKGVAEVSRDQGDVVLTGRLVDCNAGSKAAKWIVGLGAGSAAATWDMKFVDAQSGQLLAAIHHRAISGTAMSDIGDKIIKWLDEALGPALRAGLAGTYASGKRAKD
jgi:Domain of unknown function (DUF4410)